MTDFVGRVAIITGAGKGLGRAYALALGARGVAVIVNRRHPGERDEDTCGGHFRLGYNVETPSAPGEGTPMADVYRAISTRPGRPYPSATAAFDSLLRELGLPQVHAAADASQS